MSGRQLTTLAGQAIGAAAFGSLGAAAGGLVGSVIGGALFNKDTPIEPVPELADGKIQTSAYGGAIPILFGTMRIAGNVIWASDIRQQVIETEVEMEGGKGGPPSQMVEEVSYHIDVAIAICEGEITQVAKIFANGVMINDTTTAVQPSAVYLRDEWVGSIAYYYGTETQEPDPTIEAAVGVGNVSAYRGVAYVVLTSLNLTALKTTTLPNFEFLVSRVGATEKYHRKILQRTYFNYAQSTGVDTPNAGLPVVRFKDGIVRIFNQLFPTDNDKVELRSLDGTFLGLAERDEFELEFPVTFFHGAIPPLYPFGLWYNGVWLMRDATPVYAIQSPDNGFHWEVWFGLPFLGTSLSDALPLVWGSSPTPWYATFFCADNTHVLVVLYVGQNGNQQNGFYWYLVAWEGGTQITIVDEGTCASGVNVAFATSPQAGGDAAFLQVGVLESDLRTAWITNTNAPRVMQIEDGVLRLKADFFAFGSGAADEDTTDSISGLATTPFMSIYADNAICVTVSQITMMVFQRDVEVNPATGQPLSQVVKEICVRSQIPEDELDVVGLDAGDSPAPLTSTVFGGLIAKDMTGRAAIEALRPGYFFDAVDGDKLKFVLRGAAATETFEHDDLGAAEDDEGERVLASNIDQETELPARVNIRYISIDSNYQQSAQSSRRETTDSIEVMDAEVPCAFFDWHAALIAENNLRDIWASAGKRSFTTGLKYSAFEPTDVVFVDDGDNIRQVRLTRRADRGSLIEWEAEDIDALMYASRDDQLTFSIPQTQPPLTPGIPTDVEVMDLPPLTELPFGTTEVANYIAAAPYRGAPGWAGANVSLSRNNGQQFYPALLIQSPSTMGITLNAPLAFAGGNIFDTTSRVRVFLNNGTLESASVNDVLNHANAALIGDEIVQFCNAQLVDTDVYELTQFLRGRKGTEWAITTHSANERFILLTTKLRDLILDVGDRNSQSLMIRAAGTGSAALFPVTERFETQLARVMPYSPVLLYAVRLPDGSWRLRWNRRDRYMNDWNSGVDVPMSEAAELYDVEVYNVGDELVATYNSVDTNTLLVPSSVLGDSPTPAQITFKVWQRSAIVGRGFVAEKTMVQSFA